MVQINKFIFYTQRVEINEMYGERRDCADQRITDFIFSCGYLPIALPNSSRIVLEILKQMGTIGIVLTGGNSLVKYGGNAPERDQTDFFLIDYAVNNKIPLYGFCRGMQSILDYFGNSMQNVENHAAVRHCVSDGINTYEVNSYHNQACLTLTSNELLAELVASDGVIEMINHVELPIIGTMWHPEREKPYNSFDIKRFKKLFGES